MMFGTDSEIFPQGASWNPIGHSFVHGFYVAGDTGHIWTQAEVKLLHTKLNIPYGVAICVPPQLWPWKAGIVSELNELCIAAKHWGYPKDCPLVLDIERQTTEEQAPNEIGTIIAWWQKWCVDYEYKPIVYGSDNVVTRVPIYTGWEARWPKEVPYHPELPQGLYGWQFAGDWRGVYGSTQPIDLDIFHDQGPFLDIVNWKSTLPEKT